MTGHQILDTPLAEAYDIMRLRNPAPAVTALRRVLAASIRQVRTRKDVRTTARLAVATTPNTAVPLSVSGGSVLRQVARTGIYDTARYKSASEARMAVLSHLSNFSITLPEVQDRLTTDFAGLAALYQDTKHLSRLLPFEWDKAQAWVAQKPRAHRAGKEHSNKCDTGHPLTHSGGTGEVRSPASVMAEINDLENVLYAILDQRLASTGREGITLRFLLRAVIGFARAKGTLLVDVGCRSFAREMGQHHGTIARLLPRLVKHSGGMLSKVEDAHGWQADSYLLGLPEQWKDVAKAHAWRKGKIYGIRPVFRALGAPAALVYEAIERIHHSPTTADLVRETGLSRPTVAKELMTLAEVSMIERRHGAWQILHTTNLRHIAEWLGVQDDYEYQCALIRAQRQAWHAHLERFTEPVIREEDIYDQEISEWDSWVPDGYGELSAWDRHLLAA